ncbi:MAG: divalent-cation tolerance protein CutA [Candidatus Omnitrophota bacterium]
MKNKYVIIFVTCSSRREADSIAAALLNKRLVACANVITGIGSKFWWNGRIDKARETLVMLKTAGNRFRAVEKEVKKLHSYDIPEIIAVPIARLSEDYRSWIDNSIG